MKLQNITSNFSMIAGLLGALTVFGCGDERSTAAPTTTEESALSVYAANGTRVGRWMGSIVDAGYYLVWMSNGGILMLGTSGEYGGTTSALFVAGGGNACFYELANCVGTCLTPADTSKNSIFYDGTKYFLITGDEVPKSLVSNSYKILGASCTNSTPPAVNYIEPTTAYALPTGVSLPLTGAYLAP